MSNRIAAIGVDGGTTKTHLAAVDSYGNLLLFNETGSTNAFETGDIKENFLSLFAPIRYAEIDVAVFTLAGWDFENDQKKVRAQVEAVLSTCSIKIKKSIFENDIFAVYHSGIGASVSGVAIASGSGTIGVAVNEKNIFRTTGFGYIAGEWGAGWEMADHAIHLVCSSLMGREESYPVLTRKAFEYFHAASFEDLVEKIIYQRDTTYRGYFLKQVYDAYLQGCHGAKKVLEKGSNELTKTIAALLKKIPGENVPVILGGSVFKTMGLLPGMKDQLKNITGTEHEFRIIQSDPVWGALRWAAKEGSINTNCINEKILIAFS